MHFIVRKCSKWSRRFKLFSKSVTSLHYETICNSEKLRRMMGDSEGEVKGEVHSTIGHEGPERICRY